MANRSPVSLWMRHFAVLVCYTGLLIFCLYLAYEQRFDFEMDDAWRQPRRHEVFWIIPTELALLYFAGQFRGFLSYFRLPDLLRIVRSIGISCGIILVFYIAVNILGLHFIPAFFYAPPLGVIAVNAVLAVLVLATFRMGLRSYREGQSGNAASGQAGPAKQRRVAIVGAGEVGSAVAADLLAKRGLGLKPVAFFDDNEQKHGHDIHGIPVVGTPDKMEAARDAYEFEQIIIALPATAHRRMLEVVSNAKTLGLETEVMPAMWELASGRVQASQVRPVELEDLLGREPVRLDSMQIREMITGHVALVTGAGGSIGGELCRQIANLAPRQLILVDQSEVQLFQIEQELIALGHGHRIVPVVANILDQERMAWILSAYRPSLLFHAAAHKHVPMMEHQPVEAVKNNSLGTYHLARLASEHKVGKFVFISTDKAVNPTSVMGCSKRLAEIAVQAQQQAPGNTTQFCAVRFGNVLGSSGSVIPTFKRQISEGGPVTVTHPEVMRYFMTIPESVGLVLQAATQAAGGEIFVLDMGHPIKIVDVARQLIELSGFRPNVDIEIKFTGLRPGEKLFEEFQHEGEQFHDTAHSRIFRFVCTPSTLAQVEESMRQLSTHLQPGARDELKKFLTQLVPEYTPYLG